MGWRRGFNHKIIADIFEKDGLSVIFFNLACSIFYKKSERLFVKEHINKFETITKSILFTRLFLSQKLADWQIEAKAETIRGFDTDVIEMPRAAQEILKQEVENNYVGV